MKKLSILTFTLCVLFFLNGCSENGPAVTLSDEGSYYNVLLNFSYEPNHKIVGGEYAEQIKTVIPDFEGLVDSYIAEITMDDTIYNIALSRTMEILPQVPQEYRDEIAGMAEKLASAKENIRGDNKLSADELYLFNLVPDVLRQTQCSFLSVFGKLSETGKMMTARNLDWPGGSKNQIPRIQAVITYKNKNTKVCSVGYLGYMGIITGFNDKKVFGAILDSTTGAPYDSKGKSSYPMDLRFALESKTGLDEVAEYMKDPAREYAVNHLIALSDPKTSAVLENNFSGNGADMHRALRKPDSVLNDGITWGIENAVAAVNSFMLKGNHDNHTGVPINTERWDSMKSELAGKGEKVTLDELKAIISFDNNDGPGEMGTGDLYTSINQMAVIFQPGTLDLEVFFRPRDSLNLPGDPVFIKVPVF